ncbi:MAG: branched-chain amino acid ABC transporter permease [Deltaproteobacteria bacterium]|uniref:Branched-chain amino acid ABC transporter permease n=1 Tax=Candidatus Zymogenus saltonus TaxID=2844893 RepID=A0A9D8KGW9_9DELT|nr:branched-chain amino acid ABC transporter permease [Candidatus Zymogenus saltonus]
MSVKRDYIYIAILIAVVSLFPFFLTNDYYLHVLILIGLHTIIVLGLNILMGYAGQISLGHAAFYGLGAYTSGILTAHYNFHPVFAALIALVFVGSVAFVVGIPSLKLRGHYLAMATLGFGIIVSIIFNEMKLPAKGTDLPMGGPEGITNIPKLYFLKFNFGLDHILHLKLGELTGISQVVPNLYAFNIVFDTDLKYYYVVWIFAVLILIVSNNIIHSRVGRALRALHTSETAASTLGIDIQKYKLSAFVLSALYASIAGSLYAHFIASAGPSSFGFHKSIMLVVMVVVGGMASIWGSIFGAAVITILPEFIDVLKNFVIKLQPELFYLFEDFDIIVYGLILMIILIFMPEGLTKGIVDRVKGRFFK